MQELESKQTAYSEHKYDITDMSNTEVHLNLSVNHPTKHGNVMVWKYPIRKKKNYEYIMGQIYKAHAIYLLQLFHLDVKH